MCLNNDHTILGYRLLQAGCNVFVTWYVRIQSVSIVVSAAHSHIYTSSRPEYFQRAQLAPMVSTRRRKASVQPEQESEMTTSTRSGKRARKATVKQTQLSESIMQRIAHFIYSPFC